MSLPDSYSSYLHQRISESVREDIVSGKIPVGTRLPAMERMAKDWETSYFTIRRALAPLVREGMLESRGKLGTVVIGPKPALTTVGIYYGADVWSIPEAAFYRSIHRELCGRIEGTDMRMRVFIEPRPSGRHGTPHADLEDMVEDRTVQGLIIPIADEEEMRWLGRLPIPKSYYGCEPVSWRVQLDFARGMRTALRKLRDKGVVDVGLIASNPSHFKAPHPTALFYESFLDLLKEFGMRTRNHWCAIPGEMLKPDENEQFGYESFQKIWDTHPRRRPEGLICVSDVIGRGLFFALLEKQITVPGRLRVVQYKNKRTGFFAPLDVDWVVWDEARVAEALLQQLQRQIQGEEAEEIVISNCTE